jgi:hypothetical protein
MTRVPAVPIAVAEMVRVLHATALSGAMPLDLGSATLRGLTRARQSNRLKGGKCGATSHKSLKRDFRLTKYGEHCRLDLGEFL